MSYATHTVRARFKPHRTDDLRPEVEPFVGVVGERRALWRMDYDDPFPGELAYQLVGNPDFWYWVPERDLEFLGARDGGADGDR